MTSYVTFIVKEHARRWTVWYVFRSFLLVSNKSFDVKRKLVKDHYENYMLCSEYLQPALVACKKVECLWTLKWFSPLDAKFYITLIAREVTSNSNFRLWTRPNIYSFFFVVFLLLPLFMDNNWDWQSPLIFVYRTLRVKIPSSNNKGY